ncbi:MAG: hypothetical protein OXE42_13710 [Gammaproteobacteria bacterium]|nr:hypothetical protein [Gammaproteobacteria bacterium]
MPEKGVRSTYSQCPFELQMYDEQGMIATGSAFFFEINDEWFLITNWHNVSGKHFLENRPLLNGRFPTRLVAKLSSYDIEDSPEGSFGIVPFDVSIYQNDEPLWLEHPELSSRCDVIALPLQRPASCPEFMHNAVNRISGARIPVEPGGTVFIVGFPRSISVGFGLPLWKSGYIASEPHYDITIGGKPRQFGGLSGGIKLPAFFLDSQTREGMSGSPVFASYFGTWDTVDPYSRLGPDDPGFWERDDVFLGSKAIEFVGCYSGRIGPEEEGAALGMCWRKDVIEKICIAKKRGRHPHINYASPI